MVKKHFLPTPDMVSQARGDGRSAFLPPFALSDSQTHVWSNEIIEHLKDEQLPFEFLFYLRCRQGSPNQRAQTAPQREIKPLDIGRIYRFTDILQSADKFHDLLQRMAAYHLL